MSAGDDNSSPATDNATTEMLVAKLEAFYEFVNPGKSKTESAGRAAAKGL